MFSHPCSPRSRNTLRFACIAASLVAVSVASEALVIASGDPPPPPWSFGLDLTEVRSIDGTGNSIGGAANTPLKRTVPADYPDDGSGETMLEWPQRENPRTISNRIVHQGAENILNANQRSDYLWAWGQFIDHDIDLSEADDANGVNDIPIVDPTDPLGPLPIFFSRSNYDPTTSVPGNPRNQINEITAFIDASNVYGSDVTRANAVRSFQDGLLKTSPGNLLPFNVDGLPNAGGPSPSLFLAGDVRCNENVLLTSLHTLFMREHNRLARLIKLHVPEASDEEIYQLARKIVGAELQIVTYREFLPALLGGYAPSLEGLTYDSGTDPTISNAFSAATYRFGHSLLSPQLKLWGAGLGVQALPLRDAFFQPQVLVNEPKEVDRLLMGATIQVCQKVDVHIVDDVRNFLFGPPGAGGLDLAALNIQRGRDHGIADYNSLRYGYGLPKNKKYVDITSDASVRGGLWEMYGSVNNIDPWVGGLAEDHLPGANVGQLLMTSLYDQFARLIIGDRLSVNNDADLQSELIKSVINLDELTLANIVRANTTARLLPGDMFSVDGAESSDVIVTYDADANRIHVTGNYRKNRVEMQEWPFGFTFTGLGSTTINGQLAVTIPADVKPHVVVDLGRGSDQFYATACDFGDFIVQLDRGTDVLYCYACSADRFAYDGGPGRDSFNYWITVPQGQYRLHNLP